MASKAENSKPRNVQPKSSFRGTGSSKTFKSVKTMDTAQSAPAATSEMIAARSELLSMAIQLENLRRSNEQLQHQQEKKYSVTVDAVESLREELNRVKANNAALLAEIEIGKEKFDRLHTELIDLRQKFKSSKEELKGLKQEKKFWDNMKELIEKTEARCSRLSKMNRNLRTTLIRHHVDPDSNAKYVKFDSKTKPSVSPLRKRKPINAVSIRNKLSSDKILWS